MQFHTPAFMGNAEQSGQWRTPPIKAQLRQWWRVAYAAAKNFKVDIKTMRGEEGRVFGNAWLENNFSKSLVRIRLDSWDEGKLKKQNWQQLEKVTHPEVTQQAPADLYLGYGAITLPRGGNQPTLQSNAAIQAGETAQLSIAVPEADAPLIEQALWLMDHFGTLGGRSRNGWGSYQLIPLKETRLAPITLPLSNLSGALKLDWPHALGQDTQGALIWQTATHTDWKAAMKQLAEIKIGLRTQFNFTTGNNAPCAEARHWLSYPVTNHSVQAWGGNARLPNSLRFKVRPTSDGNVVGLIFHLPCQPPTTFMPDAATLQKVWQKVHGYLDKPAHSLTRSKE